MPPVTPKTPLWRRLPLLALLGVAPALTVSTQARAVIEEGYTPGQPPITTTWWGSRSEAALRADRDYVAGMRPHHAGALTMSAEHLRDPGRTSPLLQQLSRAIVANQTFEIGVLDEVRRNLDAPPLRLPFGITLQPVAAEGLTGKQRFFKTPIPSEADTAIGPVSEADVRFAKAMIVHHEGAVQMAREYHADAAARNGFLGLMNVDIITDQTQEIALMRRIIAAYPGDASLVRVDPSMIHGMEGMGHGDGHGGHGPAATPMGTDHAEGHGHAGHAMAAPAPARQARPASRPRPPAQRQAASRRGGPARHDHQHRHHHQH